MGNKTLQTKQIVFTKINTAEFIDSEIIVLDNIPEYSVVVKTEISTISCGTERANITGDPNIAGNSPSGVVFPRALGYSSAGTIVATGNKVTRVKCGDRVAVYWGVHRNYNLVNENNVEKMPDGLSFSNAAVSFIATFPTAAIRKVRLELGESLMVMGNGLLGQLAVRLARIAGAVPVIAVDTVKSRREEALRGGADYALNPMDKDFATTVKTLTDGGVNTCIEVTGNGNGFNEALDCMAKFGRIALLGCTRDSNFTVDYYKKIHFPGITVIGAHTLARAEKESSPYNFTHNDDLRCVMKLCASGRLDLSSLVKETVSPKDCDAVYTRLINDRDFPVCVQFDWSNI